MQHSDIILKYFSEFTPRQIEQFNRLGPLYTEWNSKINVISRKDMDQLYEKHILHSLSIAAAFDFAPGTRIIDIGTGGGFPGIPLAIFFPEVEFLLVDSIAKKIKVANEIVASIGLTNVTGIQKRAEEIKNQKFDIAVSRAVAPLKDLWRWSKPLLKKNRNAPIQNGLISLKGGDLAQEIFESGLRPRMIEVQQLFPESYFHEKYLLHIPL